jgi:ribose transport system ATP-binding protein
MSSTVLRLTNVVKTYPGVTALKTVSFDVQAGEVHALVGENGAGKSTLMGVAAGSIVPDSGTVEIDGRPLLKPSPAAAQMLGLAVVYQHSTVLDDLSVMENLMFPMASDRRPAYADAPAWARPHLAAVGAAVRPTMRADELGIAARQLVEIARALALEARVLVLDEPTESLTAAESELLFEKIAQLREAGTGIVYISHRFYEVQRIADRITVLRDGEARGTFAANAITEDDVLRLIVGRAVEQIFPDKPGLSVEGEASAAAPLLETAHLAGARFSVDAFRLQPGEIVGLAGVEGNGQREFLRALAGMEPHNGTLSVAGRSGSFSTPAQVQAAGVVYLSADRHAEGAFLPLSVRDNISALVLGQLSRFGVVSRRRETALAGDSATALDVRTPSVAAPVEQLSGGNQQKVMIARSLAAGPRVLLADEPTRGVDVGARIEIYRLLREFAISGHAVVVASSDAVELQGLCDRVLVFSRGAVVQELSGSELTERAITGAALMAGSSSRVRATQRERRQGILHRLGRSDHLPAAVLTVLIVGLALYTNAGHPLFLHSRNINSLLLLGTVLMFAAVGQLVVLLIGSIDLSVGPLIGLVVVVMSFFATKGHGNAGLVVGILVALAVGAGVGLLNGVLIRVVRLPAVVATLVTYIFLQGLSLLLRPQPAGYIDHHVAQLIQKKVVVVPIVTIAAIVLALACEWVLRRGRAGLVLRAVGSDEARARRLGANVTLAYLGAHVACSIAAVLAGLVLTSVVGVGQASLGTTYTLTSITAVVLGGASIFGGRGSFIGALLAALLLQEITTATSFLGLAEAWQDWLPGVLILAGAGVFSRARGQAQPAMISDG